MIRLFLRTLIFPALVMSTIQCAQADITDIKDDHFDGSEFKASTFVDTDFDKQTYRESSGQERRTQPSEHGPRVGSNAEKKKKKKKKEQGITHVGTGEAELAAGAISDLLGERSGPVHELPGDWVPNKIDLTANGGFGTLPDLGSPVPYHLNGHIDIQRGRPWEIGD